MSHRSLYLPRFPDVALVENASSIDMPPTHASRGRVYFQFPGGQTSTSYAKLTVEQVVEVDRKLEVVSLSTLIRSRTDPQSILPQQDTTK